MKFTVSSSALLQILLSVSKAISNKSPLPILDNFLFVLSGDTLEITASDSETTLKSSLKIDQVVEEGEIAVPAKLLTDSLKSFPEQPLSFVTKASESVIQISWANGESQLPFFPAEDYPQLQELSDDTTKLTIPAEILLDAINNTIYAVADDEFRPVMNGIFFDISAQGTTFVASDAHKLVCFTTPEVSLEKNASFILHKKPAFILKNSISKGTEDVIVKFNSKNAIFQIDGTTMICRLIEGKFPAYQSVIPKNNYNKLYIGRTDLLNAVKRVAICSNQATNHIKLKLATNLLTVSAQDLGFSIAAHEQLVCQYEGDQFEIGFKAPYLTEILSNLPYDDICIELADACRAILIVPADKESADTDICALVMPLMINA